MIHGMSGQKISFRLTGDGPELLQVGSRVELLMHVKGAAFRLRAQIEWRDAAEMVAQVIPGAEPNKDIGKLELPVQFRAARTDGFVGVYRSGVATDLDPDGICVRVDSAVALSGRFQIALSFGEDEEAGGAARVYGDDGAGIKQGVQGSIKATAEVVDVRQHPSGGAVATMRFTSISPTDRTAISSFLARL